MLSYNTIDRNTWNLTENEIYAQTNLLYHMVEIWYQSEVH